MMKLKDIVVEHKLYKACLLNADKPEHEIYGVLIENQFYPAHVDYSEHFKAYIYTIPYLSITPIDLEKHKFGYLDNGKFVKL